MPYTFPFDTCEIPYRHSSSIAQPYSVSVNLVTLTILVIAVVMTKNPYIRAFFVFLGLFEAFHIYSHIQHLPGNTQIIIIHVLAYLVNLSFLAIFIHLTGRVTPLFLAVYGAIVLLDIYFLFKHVFIGYFSTQIALIVWVIVFYWTFIRRYIPLGWLIALVVLFALIIALFVVEMKYCESMMAKHPFPYHTFLELVGTLVIVVFVRMFLFLENRGKN